MQSIEDIPDDWEMLLCDGMNYSEVSMVIDYNTHVIEIVKKEN